MNTLKIIEKIATFFSIVSAVFVVISTIATVELIQIASPTAPTDYVVVYTLLNILSYLFVMALSLAVTFVSRRAGKEKPKAPIPPQEEPTQTEEKTQETEF